MLATVALPHSWREARRQGGAGTPSHSGGYACAPPRRWPDVVRECIPAIDFDRGCLDAFTVVHRPSPASSASQTHHLIGSKRSAGCTPGRYHDSGLHTKLSTLDSTLGYEGIVARKGGDNTRSDLDWPMPARPPALAPRSLASFHTFSTNGCIFYAVYTNSSTRGTMKAMSNRFLCSSKIWVLSLNYLDGIGHLAATAKIGVCTNRM